MGTSPPPSPGLLASRTRSPSPAGLIERSRSPSPAGAARSRSRSSSNASSRSDATGFSPFTGTQKDLNEHFQAGFIRYDEKLLARCQQQAGKLGTKPIGLGPEYRQKRPPRGKMFKTLGGSGGRKRV